MTAVFVETPTATRADVQIWVEGRFGVRFKGAPTASMITGYNRAHPDRPYRGKPRPAKFDNAYTKDMPA